MGNKQMLTPTQRRELAEAALLLGSKRVVSHRGLVLEHKGFFLHLDTGPWPVLDEEGNDTGNTKLTPPILTVTFSNTPLRGLPIHLFEVGNTVPFDTAQYKGSNQWIFTKTLVQGVEYRLQMDFGNWRQEP
ncbi:MAG: hypothetical protein A3H88_01865 [Candidatus Blackburnbacteria bacterium RIFCSPLOWO2_02_FULL_44_9]|nr:MAG: hypothetical protein A3H88_01865 [Candidatus Blackburnbacteria bacterium RIFCSPLOWO2_02_FULL_44_9]